MFPLQGENTAATNEIFLRDRCRDVIIRTHRKGIVLWKPLPNNDNEDVTVDTGVREL
jgi:non-homologous end joining protein Ku